MTQSDDAMASDSKKSKQERIRDNQRRSRARRQEHLSDLEKRLADCHNVCREAELQRDTLKELQAENARLRELLAFAGVTNAFIDTYVHQRTDNQESAFRQLRPKLALGNGQATPGSLDAGTVTTNRAENYRRSATSNSPDPERQTGLASSPSTDSLDVFHSNLHPQSAAFQPGFAPSQPGVLRPPTRSDMNFRCDSFHLPSNGPLREASDDTILCSAAKELIDQYCVNSEEMELIKARLATGFSKPAMPNQGCRVNNQLLFQILNDIISRWS